MIEYYMHEMSEKGSYSLSGLSCMTNHNLSCSLYITPSHGTMLGYKGIKFQGNTTFTNYVTGTCYKKGLFCRLE